jgi:hypothetical protein
MSVALFVAILALAILIIGAIKARGAIGAYKKFLKKDAADQARDIERTKERLSVAGSIDFDLGFVSFFFVFGVFLGLVGFYGAAVLCIWYAGDAASHLISKLLMHRVARHHDTLEQAGVYAY